MSTTLGRHCDELWDHLSAVAQARHYKPARLETLKDDLTAGVIVVVAWPDGTVQREHLRAFAEHSDILALANKLFPVMAEPGGDPRFYFWLGALAA